MKKLPKGLWPVMLTPIKEDNTVDYDCLEKLTEFYLSSGAAGLFANCLSSEMFQLTADERVEVTKRVVRTVNGRVPVISTGSFSTDMEVTSAFVKRLYDIGSTVVVISTSQPSLEGDSEDMFRTKMDVLLKKTGDIPLGLYECPVPYKRLLSPKTVGWLAGSERFFYHKDTSCDLKMIQRKIEAVKDTPLGIYNAHVPTGLESIVLGARGLSPIAANLYPELFRYLLQNFESGSNENEIKKLNNLLDIMDTIIHQNYPYSAKLFLQGRGFNISTKSRISRGRITPQFLNKLKTVKKVFNSISEELDIELTDPSH
jgi:4-hydroxy-tetrahydrodipicolinate synthase